MPNDAVTPVKAARSWPPGNRCCCCGLPAPARNAQPSATPQGGRPKHRRAPRGPGIRSSRGRYRRSERWHRASSSSAPTPTHCPACRAGPRRLAGSCPPAPRTNGHPCRRGARSRRGRAALGPVGAVGIGAGHARIVAPWPARGAAGACCVFPFGLARQPPTLDAALLVEPADVGLRVHPADADHRFVVLLAPARLAPATASAPGPGGVFGLPGEATRCEDVALGLGQVAAGARELPPLRHRHFGLAKRQGLHAHPPLQTFVVAPLGLAHRAAHREFAARDHHHLRAGVAVARRRRRRGHRRGHRLRLCRPGRHPQNGCGHCPHRDQHLVHDELHARP